MFADLGTLAKKHQMYWIVLFTLQLIKTHPSQSSLSWQTILWPTQTHWASINIISSAAFHLQLCRAHCLGRKCSIALGATLHVCDWLTKVQFKMVTPGFAFFVVVNIQVLSIETAPARVGPIHIQDQILLVATMSMTQQTRREWVWVPASLEPWGRDVLNLINRDWIMWFTSSRVAYRFSSAQMFLQRLAEIKTSAADFKENLLVKKQGTAFFCCGLISSRW